MSDYTARCQFTGTPETVLLWSASMLCKNGFAITERQSDKISLRGPGMSSTNQNPILGVSEIELRIHHDRLEARAELKAAKRMQNFVRRFPLQLSGGLCFFLTVVLGLIFGQAFGVGFGVPQVQGIWWALLTSAIGILPTAPWLFISPIMARAIRRRTEEAVETLVKNAALISGR